MDAPCLCSPVFTVSGFLTSPFWLPASNRALPEVGRADPMLQGREPRGWRGAPKHLLRSSGPALPRGPQRAAPRQAARHERGGLARSRRVGTSSVALPGSGGEAAGNPERLPLRYWAPVLRKGPRC